ncbi:MAG: D-Ala-D-Ala carboxypeptidase family metallohydrolase [Candidatus Bathyarchaeia archaeon]
MNRMGDISKHFSRREMLCQCNSCGFDTIDAETLRIAEEVREFVGHPITPSSAARCAVHNSDVGGKSSSLHLSGRAIDLPVRDPKAVYEFLCEKYPGQYGFGLYEKFVHLDTRSGKMARWYG